MRYLILAAGMGRRLDGAQAGIPKCLIEIGGEPLLGRLLRQIRRHDPVAEVVVVLGYRAETIAPVAAGCRIILNPFFDITGINASLWFAREVFDGPVTVIHGDVVLANALAADLFAAADESLIAYDSRVLDPKEINVAVAAGRVTRFGVNYAGYSGAYAGIFRLSTVAARLFAATLDARVRRGYNEPRTYYFFAMRRLLAEPGVAVAGFDLAAYRWQEIDTREDIVAAQARFPDRGEAHGG